MSAGESTHQRLMRYLKDRGAVFEHFVHSEAKSSAEALAARTAAGFASAVGAKALLLTLNNGMVQQLVLPGFAKLDNKVVRETFGKCAFSSAEVTSQVSGGLVFGTIPPFGAPVLPGVASSAVDEQLQRVELVGFNAASLTSSIVMTSTEYFRVIGDNAKLCRFCGGGGEQSISLSVK